MHPDQNLCNSSGLMTSLLNWRNPRGNEINYRGRAAVPGYYHFLQRKVAAEIGFALIAITATVEAIAQVIFTALILMREAFFQGRLDNRRYFVIKGCLSRIESCVFTQAWAVTSFFISNIFYSNLSTRESEARQSVRMAFRMSQPRSYRLDSDYAVPPPVYNPPRVPATGSFDNPAFAYNPPRVPRTSTIATHDYSIPRIPTSVATASATHDYNPTHNPTTTTTTTIHHPTLPPVKTPEEQKKEKIDIGSDFIINEVLIGFDESTRTAFKDMDTEIYQLVSTKAVFIYAFGSKCKEPVPTFFKEETQEGIVDLRLERIDKKIVEKIKNVLKNLSAYETSESALKDDIKAKDIFKKIREISSGELQQSLFLTSCFTKAIEKLG